jgi:Leucine-rich repeat (LRR) protein
MKCSGSWCTAENGLTDEMMTQFKTKDGNWEHKNLTLKNVSNEDLKKLPALKDVLESLRCWDKCEAVTDLSPVATLENLTHLELRDMENLTDLSPIPKLKKLETLMLYSAKNLTDLTPLGELKGLKKLELYNAKKITDFSPLANLSELQRLYLGLLNYPDLEFLTPLNNLERLQFVAEPEDITDISPLAGKTQLKELHFNKADVTDLSPLKDAKNLEKLELSGTKVSDLSVLKELKKLTSLDLGYIQSESVDLEPVGELSELTYIDLTNSTSPDYSPLARCTKLERIEAANKSGFNSLDVIKALPHLKYLNLGANQNISEWSALAEMTSLEDLYLRKTSFSDLNLLAKMNHLDSLSISECTVKNAAAIATLPKLRYLNIDGTQGIDDITIFKNLAQIDRLNLRHKKDQFPQEQVDLLNQTKDAAKKLKKVFEEKFVNNRKEWYLIDNEECTVKIEDGRYIFDHKREKGAWFAWKSPEIDPQKDFLIEVTATKLSGVNKAYGLVWGLKDLDHRYQFGVANNGYYSYGKSENGTWQTLIDWTASDAINTEDASENKLSLRKVGEQLKFYVNDRYVAEVPFGSFFGPNVGFVVHDTMQVAFDNFLVKN